MVVPTETSIIYCRGPTESQTFKLWPENDVYSQTKDASSTIGFEFETIVRPGICTNHSLRYEVWIMPSLDIFACILPARFPFRSSIKYCSNVLDKISGIKYEDWHFLSHGFRDKLHIIFANVTSDWLAHRHHFHRKSSVPPGQYLINRKVRRPIKP